MLDEDNAALAGDENETTEIDADEDAELLEDAQRLYKHDREHWEPIYRKAKADLEFLSDEDGSQWPEKEYKEREKAGKPAFNYDYLTQFVHQVANNIRMNTPSINPIPSGDGADQNKAQVIKGLIKRIEYNSCADEVYDTAATSAVKCSIGFAIIDHDYVPGDKQNNQQIIIKRVINPFLIFIDSESIESDGRDMEHANILEKMTVRKFKEKWPEAEVCSFGDESEEQVELEDGDEVTISQFLRRVTTKEKITIINRAGKRVQRTTEKYHIERYRLSGKEVLERTTFPGRYIPVVPFYGEEAWIDGKRHLHSLIRKAKGAQIQLNVMKSVEQEILLKQPFAPVMVPGGAIENYAEDWENPGKAFALRYDQWTDEGQQLNAPIRLEPPKSPQGIVQSQIEAVNDIRATIGMYQNSLGQAGQEVSGKAIDARKIQGDISTYHFGDNTVRSITQIGRCVVCMIGEIYDAERTIDIINEEDKPENMGINGMKVADQEESHDLTTGDYDIRVITGSSFTTMRQESAMFYQDLIKAQPQMLMVCGDLMFENMDVAGAQAMASRMKKLIDPKLLSDDKQEDPEKAQLEQKLQQAMQVIEQGQGMITDLQNQLKDKSALEQAKVQNDSGKLALQAQKQEQDADDSKFDKMMKMMELMLKDRGLDITEQNNAGNLAIKSEGQDTEQMLNSIQMLTDMINNDQEELPAEGDASANNGGAQTTEGIPQ